MHVMIGFVLSLSLAAPKPWDGNNGFDPTSMYVLRQGSAFLVDGESSQEFGTWLEKDPGRRDAAVRYFVICAFDPSVVITWGTRYQWRGALGLAPSLKSTLSRLRDTALLPPPTKQGESTPKYARASSPLVPHPDDGLWVSACLMALANGEGRHQYVSLRGNPMPWKKDPLLNELTPGKAWTFGYPEGVFFADLLNFNVEERHAPAPTGEFIRKGAPFKSPPRSHLQKSYTMSLNLPEDYPGLPPATWAPPNASLGRTLDFNEVTLGTIPEIVGPYRVARRLGEFPGMPDAFALEVPAALSDTAYPYDTVCVAGGQAVVPCGPRWAEKLHPIFVHAPRLARLGGVTPVDSTLIMQAIDSGAVPLTVGEMLDCQAGTSCAGPFKLHSTGEPPTDPTGQVPQVLQLLKKGQSVTAVLRFQEGKERLPLKPGDLAAPYTALVRYWSAGQAKATVEVSDRPDRWRVAGDTWEKTDGWQWLQIYPVYVVADDAGFRPPTLKVKVSGLDPKGTGAPTLDVAGFVSLKPRCLPDRAKTFMGVCPDPVLPPTFPATPAPVPVGAVPPVVPAPK